MSGRSTAGRTTVRSVKLTFVRRCLVIVLGLTSCYRDDPPSSEGGETTEGPSTSATPTTSASSDGEDVGTTGAPTSCVPTEQGVRDAVFGPHCATGGCHDAMTAAGSLDLSVDNPEALLANAAAGTCDGEVLVVPGDASSSFLLAKLGEDSACGDVMPPGASLEVGLVECVADWIDQAEGTCPTCGGATCVDTNSSALHCGACNQPCPAGVPCMSGECSCPASTTLCGDTCLDTDSDPAHCGGCDRPCDAGLFCLEGNCTDDCGTLTECSGACVDLDTNPLHCGDCNAPCADAEACEGAMCGCDAPALSYADDIEPYIVEECASMGCHRPMGMSAGAEDLDLRAGVGYDAMVGVPAVQCDDRMLVEPGQPGSSYLYDKVLGVNLCSGTQMPKSGSGPPAAQIQAISDWICSGAAP